MTFMKRFIAKISFILVAIMTVTFLSCGDEYPSEGYFNINENTYAVNEARLEDLGYENGYYQLRLTLDNPAHNDFHSINFLLYSEVNNYLPSGLYTPYLYDNNFEHKFKRGGWVVGNNIEGVILMGSVKVTKSNDIYKIRIDCEDTEGKNVTGYYDGKMKVVI